MVLLLHCLHGTIYHMKKNKRLIKFQNDTLYEILNAKKESIENKIGKELFSKLNNFFEIFIKKDDFLKVFLCTNKNYVLKESLYDGFIKDKDIKDDNLKVLIDMCFQKDYDFNLEVNQKIYIYYIYLLKTHFDSILMEFVKKKFEETFTEKNILKDIKNMSEDKLDDIHYQINFNLRMEKKDIYLYENCSYTFILFMKEAFYVNVFEFKFGEKVDCKVINLEHFFEYMCSEKIYDFVSKILEDKEIKEKFKKIVNNSFLEKQRILNDVNKNQ
jgi:hypothetical protein